MLDSKTIDKIQYSTCGICSIDVSPVEYVQDKKKESLFVYGSGFLVRPTTVITNRHVLTQVNKDLEDKKITKDNLYLWFIFPAENKIKQGFCKFKNFGVITNNDTDIGLIEFVRRSEPEFSVCRPLEVIEDYQVQIGDPIAICGYPYGDNALRRNDRTLYRYGPIIQQGYISAIAPFSNTSPENIQELLLDIRTAKGMSGSPVIRTSDSLVIGVHYAGIGATTAFAIPLENKRLDTWLRLHDKNSVTP